MISINSGEEQPLDCLSCKRKSGYVVTEKIQKYNDDEYDEFGKHQGTTPTDFEKPLRTIKKTKCAYCGKFLPFKIK